MPNLLPLCFRRAAAGTPSASTAGPGLATSIYETHLGLAALSWSRTALGLSIRAELCLLMEDSAEEETIRFSFRPWLLWRRRGSRRLRLRRRTVDIAWDLSRARFPPGGSPEPSAGYFVSIAVDGEFLLVAGDLGGESSRRAKAALVLRREHVVLRGAAYRTSARFGGEEREVEIEVGDPARADAGMSVAVNGRRILHVRRLRWKFRGSERVKAEGGAWIQISWDLHSWFFPPPEVAATSAPAAAEHAVFVFRFEKEAEDDAQGYLGKSVGCGGAVDAKAKGGDFRTEGGYFGKRFDCGGAVEGKGGGFNADGRYFGKGVGCGGAVEGKGANFKVDGGYFGKSRNWSESSSGGGRRRRRKKGLLKTSSSSSSSTSSASSASSSTVMGWASPEEAELRSADGFSLVVYAWKR